MTDRPEAPTLEQQMMDIRGWIDSDPESPYANAILASLERLREIELDAGMPEEPDIVNRIMNAESLHDNPNVSIQDTADLVAYIDALRARCLHLADRLATMEALLREPDEEMRNVIRKHLQHDLVPPFSKEIDDMLIEETVRQFKAMSAALLAKLEKEKE